jgi:hypothetical protein
MHGNGISPSHRLAFAYLPPSKCNSGSLPVKGKKQLFRSAIAHA